MPDGLLDVIDDASDNRRQVAALSAVPQSNRHGIENPSFALHKCQSPPTHASRQFLTSSFPNESKSFVLLHSRQRCLAYILNLKPMGGRTGQR
ncbi:hypothetical protein ColKHC_00467 [Colletotrichum higginsianum]|nr:hypothetical protein ColKHC_00467 [Colletotrichum higginsianum]